MVGERDIFRTIRATIPQQYTIMRMSQLQGHLGSNKMEKIKKISETEDLLPSAFDLRKTMNTILSKKRFADASVIFIELAMSDDEEERGSNVDLITSVQSSECHIRANSSFVDPGMTLNSSAKLKLQNVLDLDEIW